LDFNTASLLIQQSVGRHVAPLGHIILILGQPVFAHLLLFFNVPCLAEKQEITNFILFGLIPLIEHANHYTVSNGGRESGYIL